MSIKFDPFGRVNVSGQIDMVSPFANHDRTLELVKKKIVQLSRRVDEMKRQNDGYMRELNNSKDLLLSKTCIGDVITSNGLNIVPGLDRKPIADNQVVSVRDISGKLNIRLVSSKTGSVVRRVCQMIKKDSSLVDKSFAGGAYVPELKIVANSVQKDDTTVSNSLLIDEDGLDDIFEATVEDGLEEVMFETVTPFIETLKYVDKIDDPNFPEIVAESDADKSNDDAEMPAAFWVTSNSAAVENTYEEGSLSFEDGLRLLGLDEGGNISGEPKDNVKVRKRVA